MLELMTGILYLETRRENGVMEILLLGGVAPWEFLERESFSVSGVRTDFGMMELNCMDNRLAVAWNRPLPAGTCLRLPEHFAVEFDGPVRAAGEGLFELHESVKEITCRITVDPAIIYSKSNTGLVT